MPLYEFRCDTCGQLETAYRRLGDTQSPLCPADGAVMRRIYSTGGQITRPKGYHLHPGDKGYWDFGDLNDPDYRPPEQVEPFSMYRAAEDRAAREDP